MPMTRAVFLRSLLAGAGVLAAGRLGTGEAVPVVGVGNWRGFDVGQNADSRARLTRVLQELFNAGGTVIDSSPMYGTSEEVTGDLLAAMDMQAKAFVATKVWASGRAARLARPASHRRSRSARV